MTEEESLIRAAVKRARLSLWVFIAVARVRRNSWIQLHTAVAFSLIITIHTVSQ